MRKSVLMNRKFDSIVNHLEVAWSELSSVMASPLVPKLGNEKLMMAAFKDLIEDVETLQYETCGPLESDEDEKYAKLEQLRIQVAELENELN